MIYVLYFSAFADRESLLNRRRIVSVSLQGRKAGPRRMRQCDPRGIRVFM